MYHIYSTMANDNEYVKYNEHGPKGINIAEDSVLIRGGSGINKKYLQTPLGVHTLVSDEDMAWLENDYSFKQHVKNGYITVKKQKVDAEVAAADMVTHDRKSDACPIVPQDFKQDGDRETVKPAAGKGKKVA